MSIFSQNAARVGGLPAPLQGALYMTAAAAVFSIMIVLIRNLSASFDPMEIAFFRNFFAVAVMLPWLLRRGPSALATQRLPLHLLRACLGLGAMVCWFYSIALLPLAEAVSLNFTAPLFATAGAALLLGEVVRARRWSATVVGFLGVLVIVRPGFVEVSPAMILPIMAAMIMACSIMVVKSLSSSEDPNAIVLYMNLLLTPLSLIPALFFWRWPGLWDWPALFGVGALAAVAHSLMTRAYMKADASAVMPFDYARLPFIALVAYLAFGEVPDFWTWLGGGIIAGAAIYIAHREARVAKERPVQGAASEAPKARL